MAAKRHTHRVTLNDQRRESKMAHDVLKKGVSKHEVSKVFNTYYRDQVRALYKAISGGE